jgi:hypothetical protein
VRTFVLAFNNEVLTATSAVGVIGILALTRVFGHAELNLLNKCLKPFLRYLIRRHPRAEHGEREVIIGA